MQARRPSSDRTPETFRSHVMARDGYRLRLTSTGAGDASWEGQSLTRDRGDRVEEGDGWGFYLRDLDQGQIWSPTLHPTGCQPEAGEALFGEDRALFWRRDGALESRLEVALLPDRHGERRRLCLVNSGSQSRRIEVTTCLEVVLNHRDADAAHPGFSKLFVQTEWHAEARALLAWRRPRGADEAPRWMGLWAGTDAGEGLSIETDRARFLGRGRRMSMPQALDEPGPLSGTTGSVLDPVLAFRQVVELAPGETRTLSFVLAWATDREAALAAPDATGGEAPWSKDDAGWKVRVDLAGPVAPARFRPREAKGTACGMSGSFAEDGRSYVMDLPPQADGRPALPPLPWCNVIAHETFGFLATERGLSCTWSRNSRLHRLTPWINDPVGDPLPEAFFLRDAASEAFWSLTPGPAGQGLRYTVRHGFGHTTWESWVDGLGQEVTAYVVPDERLRVVRIRLHQDGPEARRLQLFWMAHLVLGEYADRTVGYVDTAEDQGVLTATSRQGRILSEGLAFAKLLGTERPVQFTTDRRSFLGHLGSLEAPRAVVEAERLDGACGQGMDPCFAFQAELDLAPGETRELFLLLGEADDTCDLEALLARMGRPEVCLEALANVQAFWEDVCGGIQVETPEPALDRMVNGWLTYQNLSCRLWGRTAYYQSGGAYGFRDQLQDATALVTLCPEVTRRQILLNAAHQFVEGDVLHWWHPPIEEGIRTHFSDDLLWLPYLAAHYVRATGDWGVLEEAVPYLEARLLGPVEDEAYLKPTVSAVVGDVYEHCCRALDHAAGRRGRHGLPLMGTGDWNDGMNRVGRLGMGESVWMGFFLFTILEGFLPLALRRGDTARVEACRRLRSELQEALETAGWDGAWYRRAYHDDGSPLGSAENEECQIDCLAQAWAVISGAAPADRARMAMEAARERLVDESAGLIRLLTPPFDTCPHDPGYIKGYIPGVRENGGQYTHGALWAVKAFAMLGDMDTAARLLTMVSPVTRGAHASTYQVEPYVIAADVYGVAPHIGRGGWTWYTGSAGWMYRVTLEDLLGFSLEEGSRLCLRPRLPKGWPGFVLRHRDRATGGITVFDVSRQPGLSSGLQATLEGPEPVQLPVGGGVVRMPLPEGPGERRVRIVLGEGGAL